MSAEKDNVRRAAWSVVAVAAIAGAAGVVYEPAPDPEVFLAGAHMMMRIQAYDQAMEQLDQAFALDPDNAEAHLLMGSIQCERGEDALALESYERGFDAIDPVEKPELLAMYRVSTGLLKLRLGRFDDAMHDGDLLVAEGLRPAAGCLIRAFSWLGRGDDTAFRQELARAYSMDPTDSVFRLPAGFLSEAIPWTAAFSISDG